METASGKWSELDMVFQQYLMMNPIGSFDDISHFQTLSSDSYSSDPNIDQKPAYNNMTAPCIETSHQVEAFERPMKQLKSNSWTNSSISGRYNNIPPPKASPSSSHIISFSNSNNISSLAEQYNGLDYAVKPEKEVSKTRTPLHAQDHVIAERKRREKLSQRFICLSKLIPGLTKTDKASVLGDAINYVKQLQERVTTLEEQAAMQKVESVVIVKKTQIYADDETSSSDENFDSNSNKPLPQIEARVSDKNVLIRIHCEKNKGCISNIIHEIENLHLSVLNSNVLPFGHTLDITIVAQMESEFMMTVKDLVKSLRRALLKFM